MFYYIARAFMFVVYKLIFKFNISGAENIPKTGGVIFCSNHSSNFDPVSVGVSTKRAVHYLAKKELFDKKLLVPIFKGLKAFPIDRTKTDFAALKKGINLLKDGEALGIFAQGTRVKAEENTSAKSGVALFALKAGVPVVPVRLEGEYKLFGRVNVTFGEPISLDEYKNQKVSSDKLQNIAEQIMKKVNELGE